MIYETLQILKEQLDNYLTEEGFDKIVILDNIALWDPNGNGNSNLDKKVVITLLNMEEEATLKNMPNNKIKDGITEYKNPPVHLNLYLLITANFDKYENALRSISKVIQFFQGKKVFTSANTVYNRTNVAFDLLDYFKFIVELYTPDFEKLNYVWGTLGGRQLPSVMYKVQLVQLERDRKLSASGVITHVGGVLNDIG
ncbi:DUF4255 domain-containing protein [Gaoshiqia sp. Z1-71]|uniref:DUF4255 domain-containing protein n=1 Tax=Gaoshiqia hydrogeniformans TaxID=3290090 RepID=UPI003BF8781B